jgi:hypothetical protein
MKLKNTSPSEHGTRWTKAEEKELKSLVKQKLNANEIGKNLGRSARSIHQKMYLLGIKSKTGLGCMA